MVQYQRRSLKSMHNMVHLITTNLSLCRTSERSILCKPEQQLSDRQTRWSSILYFHEICNKHNCLYQRWPEDIRDIPVSSEYIGNRPEQRIIRNRLLLLWLLLQLPSCDRSISAYYLAVLDNCA